MSYYLQRNQHKRVMDRSLGDDGVYGNEEKVRDAHLRSEDHAKVVAETKRMMIEQEKKDTEGKLVEALTAMTKSMVESAARAQIKSQQVAGIASLTMSEITNLDKIVSHDAGAARDEIVSECHRVIDVLSNKIQVQVDNAVKLGEAEYASERLRSKQDFKNLAQYDTWDLNAAIDYEALFVGVEGEKDKTLANFNRSFRVFSNEVITKIEAVAMHHDFDSTLGKQKTQKANDDRRLSIEFDATKQHTHETRLIEEVHEVHDILHKGVQHYFEEAEITYEEVAKNIRHLLQQLIEDTAKLQYPRAETR